MITKKTILKNPDGISAKTKFMGQLLVAVAATAMIMQVDNDGHATKLAMPFFKDFVMDLSFFYFAFALFVIIGTSNAVNLTDGLDGLAIMPSVIAFATIGLFCVSDRSRKVCRLSAYYICTRCRRAEYLLRCDGGCRAWFPMV